MKIVLFIATLLVAFNVLQASPTYYGANKCPTVTEVFKHCGNPCQATCENRSPACEFTCSRGCYCPYGQLRNANWQCVLPANC